MPPAFDRCVKAGGRVRTVKPRADRYLRICYPKGGGSPVKGYLKKVKQPGNPFWPLVAKAAATLLASRKSNGAKREKPDATPPPPTGGARMVMRPMGNVVGTTPYRSALRRMRWR